LVRINRRQHQTQSENAVGHHSHGGDFVARMAVSRRQVVAAQHVRGTARLSSRQTCTRNRLRLGRLGGSVSHRGPRRMVDRAFPIGEDAREFAWRLLAISSRDGDRNSDHEIVSPLSEEAGFRGYLQVSLERDFSGVVAVLVSSVFFALVHLNHGAYWPKQLVYFLAGVVFGAIAFFTKSLWPGIVAHVIGDMTFFIFVWPHDAARHLVSEGGADAWFWMHAAQGAIFTGLAILAFAHLASLTVHVRATAAGRNLPASA
jgi:Type II CAAX prenyl endopeptidase Rce1-like